MDGDTYHAGRGGIISISRQLPHLRQVFITHEAMHGVFYMEDGFRTGVFSYWENLHPDEREFWRLFFQFRDFDPEDEYLMVNEFQAYILQQEEAEVDPYFHRTWIWRLREARPDKVSWINDFLQTRPNVFTGPADDLNRLLWTEARLAGGDVIRVRRRQQ
jgi:hypothetical protein